MLTEQLVAVSSVSTDLQLRAKELVSNCLLVAALVIAHLFFTVYCNFIHFNTLYIRPSSFLDCINSGAQS